jgi:imidazolonepropionase-like amidohydrolase
VATLLPIASFYLKLGRFAPGRMLIDQGVPVALATDVNPGGGFSPSMPFAMSLACFAMNLTFEEALVAATINAAYALDRHAVVGSLEPGKQMDAVIVDGPAIDLVRADDHPRGDQERARRGSTGWDGWHSLTRRCAICSPPSARRSRRRAAVRPRRSRRPSAPRC